MIQHNMHDCSVERQIHNNKKPQVDCSHLAGEDFVECVAVISQCDTCIWRNIINVDVFVEINNKLALGMNL